MAADRLDWIERMLAEVRALPLADREAFFSDRRNVWTAESCLRRALEALFDLGRHILAKGFGLGVSEYKEIAVRLAQQGILSQEDSESLRVLAGYRNRLVHFYHEVGVEELYDICTLHLGDLERLANSLRAWLAGQAERLDGSL
ncbi:MAG: type VII toxin-antitoxin system HepT family RNase toxin [Anaerolineae bacterium]